jgi:thiol-disulfide isomerase/thioredoxin
MRIKFGLLLGLLLVSTGVIADPKVPSADINQLKKIIAQHKGKIVMVNFWATWCGPCVEEFPDLVKLYNKHKGNKFALIGASLDAEGDGGKVASFVKNQKAAFPVYHVRVKDPGKFIEQFDKKWGGEIPRTYLYDKNGKLVKAWSGSRSFEEFESELLAAMKK